MTASLADRSVSRSNRVFASTRVECFGCANIDPWRRSARRVHQRGENFLEEGLADWMACDLTGKLEARTLESEVLGDMRIDPALLYLDTKGYNALPLSTTRDLQRAGFDLIRRLRLERVRELALEGVPAEVYLREAGVVPPGS